MSTPLPGPGASGPPGAGRRRRTGDRPSRLTALLVAAAVIGTVAVLAAQVLPSLAEGPPPRTAPLQFGVTTPGGAGASGELDAVEALTGAPLDLVLGYADFTLPPPIADLDAVAARGATPVVTWEPWEWSDPDSGRFSLESIAAGDHDPHLWWWAGALRDWGRPLYLRFAHEQNGDWYPWAVGAGGTTAAQHVAAFRHVGDVLAAAGAGNVRLVWNPNVPFDGSSPLEDTFPGSDHVDVVGLDGYNWGDGAQGNGWQAAPDLFGDGLEQLRRLAPGVPVLVAEVASAEDGGDKAAWIGDLVQYLDGQGDVVGFVWFDHDKETDWRLASSAASARAMREALAGRALTGRSPR